jgi:transcription elongation GreA/GreB family factor
MKVDRKQALLKAIESQMESMRKAVQDARKLAASFSDATWSQSGERENYEIAAQLAEESLVKLQALRDEVKSTPNKKAMIAKPICFVELDYGDGENEEFYFVHSTVTLPTVSLITPDSPVGRAIIGKKVGDTVVYKVQQRSQDISISCTVANLE